MTNGLFEKAIPLTVNKLLAAGNYDYVLIFGATVPHEVAGFAGGAKYFFPGVAGAELTHATQIGHRLKQLGASVPGSIKLEMTQKSLQPPPDTTDVVAVIKGVLTAEEEAIVQYNSIIKLCEGDDYVTQDLAIKLLSDEEGHRQEFEGYLKEYVKQ